MHRIAKNLIQLILSSGRAWEDISAEMTPTDRLVSKCLYPMMLVAAITYPVQMFYHPGDVSVAAVIVMSMTIFVSFFVTFYIGGLFFNRLTAPLTDTGEASLFKTRTVAIYILCLLCTIQILVNFLPVHLALFYLLPAGVSLILWKSERYMTIRQDFSMKYYLVGLCCLILPPYLLQGLINFFIE